MSIPNASRNRITVDLGGFAAELLRHLCRGGNGLVPLGERGNASEIIRLALRKLGAEVIPAEEMAGLVERWRRFDPHS